MTKRQTYNKVSNLFSEKLNMLKENKQNRSPILNIYIYIYKYFFFFMCKR